MKELSVVIPILNEAKNILNLVPAINKVKKKINIKKFEILIIDDDSKDNIKSVVKKLKKKYNYVTLHVRKNTVKDLSKSCIYGFENSSYKNILVMDGDFQHNPKHIIQLFNTFTKKNFDLVIGSRDLLTKNNKGLSTFRRLSSILLIFFINFLLGQKTNDPMSGFFIFKKKIYLKNKNNMFKKGYKILSDLIYSSKEQLKIKDIPIKFNRRGSGKSKMNLKTVLNLLFFIFLKFLKKINLYSH